ncbi:MAG TPA: exodeoxyribonuclease I [Solimonas sp.]|nr:exodeoxyribonuclease I [Solimonas sp.]
MSDFTFYWHDYETTGADPARDRPAQFAGRRTTAELEPVGEPLVLYARPTADVLPHPDAVLLTGVTPQHALREGWPEHEFARAVHAELARPGTCGAGYNSIRFDDEMTRHLFYRNFHDPYEREWSAGNSRWDLIDAVRLWHALRPEGLEWPRREDGSTSFRLGHLASTNGLAHVQAHDALSDVDATIALARRLRAAQPRLFEHALRLRDRQFAANQLDLAGMTPALHVSSKIPALRGCVAVVAPLAMHPLNRNQVIVYDLGEDPAALLELDADEVRERVFASNEDLPEGIARIALKGVHLNKSPMLAPLSTLTPAQAERWSIDLPRALAHREILLSVREALAAKVQAVFTAPEFPERDPELSLYGGFLPDEDRARMARVRNAGVDELWRFDGLFQDPRYNELLFRYRARNFPDSLNHEERGRWRDFLRHKLVDDSGLSGLTLEQYQAAVAGRMAQETDPARLQLLLELARWPSDSGLLAELRRE